MQRSMRRVGSVREVITKLPGAVQVIPAASPRARRHFTRFPWCEKMTELMSHDADKWVVQAVSLRRIADDLQNGLMHITKGTPQTIDAAIETMTGDDETSWVLGSTLSTVILRALATELLLKALTLRKTGQPEKVRKVHDLLILFNDLDSETKEIVTAQESSQRIKPVPQILEEHKKDFETWRYIAESPVEPTGFWDLGKAFEVLLTVYHHKDFLNSCQDK